MPNPFRPIEDDGLVTFTRKRHAERGELGSSSAGSSPSSRDFTPAMLEQARDLLSEELKRTRPDLLDPFSPAEERTPLVLAILRKAIGSQRDARAGALQFVATDEDTLLRLYRDSIGWGPAQLYLDDPDVQEVKIIGDIIQVQERGRPFRTVEEVFSNPLIPLERVIFLASTLSVQLNSSRAQTTLPLGFRSRMHATIPPVTPADRSLVCIRRGRLSAWSLDDILRNGTCNPEVYQLLRHLVAAGCSFLIAGETGSGKTALLESLINSWPGDPHVITIQDDTDEINVTHRAWTAETVQTSRDPLAFGKAAREVLRQTPTVVAPGEIRGSEAGAVLAIAMSGHAVITTIHARSAHSALLRLADFASMPNAHSYEGRRDSALEDACSAIDVIVHLSNINGMRVIDEIALANGVQIRHGVLIPTLVPLVRLSDTTVAEGDEVLIGWECLAEPSRSDGLIWRGGMGVTPEGLRHKLLLLKHRSRSATAAPTTRVLVEEALRNVETLLLSGQAPQALALLKRAWSNRRDERLIPITQRTLEALGTFATRREQGEAYYQAMEAALARRDWEAARRDERLVGADLELSAAYRPVGGWNQLDRLIRAGLRKDHDAREAIERAESLLSIDRPAEAMDMLATVNPSELSPQLGLIVLTVRHTAAAELVAMGELQPRALDLILAQIRGFKQERTTGDNEHFEQETTP